MFQKQKQTMAAKRRQSNNHSAIIVSCCFFMVLFLGMISYICFFVATNEQEMINNSYNSRQQLLISRNYRGTIYSKDGDILAKTFLDDKDNETR